MQTADTYAKKMKKITENNAAKLVYELKETKTICEEIQSVCSKTLESCRTTQELYKEFCKKSNENIDSLADNINQEIEELCNKISLQNKGDLAQIKESLKTIPAGIDSLRKICENTMEVTAENIGLFYEGYVEDIKAVKEELSDKVDEMKKNISDSVDDKFPTKIERMFEEFDINLKNNNKELDNALQNNIKIMSETISNNNTVYIDTIKKVLEKDGKLNDESIRIMRSILNNEPLPAKKEVKRR